MTTFMLGEKVIAENVSFEDYLIQFRGQRVEYEDGKVIEMSPATGRHNEIVGFVYMLLEASLEQTQEGVVRRENITMRLLIDGKIRAPEPDLFVVTTPNLSKLTETYMNGAADLVIEVVSDDSQRRDRVTKFGRYEIAGVREYWILDPDFNETLFHVRGEDNLFHRQQLDEKRIYQSTVLPRLKISAYTLLKYPSPKFSEIGKMVNEMLQG